MTTLRQSVWMAAVIIFAASPSALADRIDGDWCSASGKHLTIKGPEITTPYGVTMQGQYGRHEFVYIAPEGDPDAKTQIYLQLLSEEEMNFYRITNNQPGEPELWRRCEVNS